MRRDIFFTVFGEGDPKRTVSKKEWPTDHLPLRFLEKIDEYGQGRGVHFPVEVKHRIREVGGGLEWAPNEQTTKARRPILTEEVTVAFTKFPVNYT